MNLTLKRDKPGADGVFGALYSGGKQIAVTLEHAFNVGDNTYAPKIAAGAYTCVRYDSPDHGYIVFTLIGVPPFMGKQVTFCEIHIGNFNADSDGCILLGSHRNGDMIMDSKVTFQEFMDRMKDINSFTLTVEDA